MKFSTRTRYGLRFLLRLAAQPDNSLLQLGQVAQEESISPGYLEQIVRALKPLGILRAVRGSGGGLPCPNRLQKSIWRMSSCIWKARYPPFPASDAAKSASARGFAPPGPSGISWTNTSATSCAARPCNTS